MVDYLSGIMRDISDLKRADEERERFFSLSLDLQGVFGFDGSLHRVNPAFEATLGFTNAELLARPYLEFVHPDDRAVVAARPSNSSPRAGPAETSN